MNLAELEDLRKEILSLRKHATNDIEQMLNNRCFATAGFATDKTIAELNKKHNENLDKLLKRVNAAIGDASTAVKDSTIGEFVVDEEIVMTDFDDITILSPAEENMKQVQETKTVEHIMKKRRFTIELQNRKMIPLNPNFKFPKMTMQQFVVNWLLGNMEKKSAICYISHGLFITQFNHDIII